MSKCRIDDATTSKLLRKGGTMRSLGTSLTTSPVWAGRRVSGGSLTFMEPRQHAGGDLRS
jgi:hypothetical protein